VSRAGQSKPSPMNELVPTIRSGSESGVRLASWSAIWRRSRALMPPLRTVTVFPAVRSWSVMAFEVFDPGGEYQDVGSGFGGGQHVVDDLVESSAVGDEGSIDFGHSTGCGGSASPAVLEFGVGCRCRTVWGVSRSEPSTGSCPVLGGSMATWL